MHKSEKNHSHVPLRGPKYPDSGSAFHGVPLPSAVRADTVLPHQCSGPAGRVMQKNMMTVATATAQSSAAERT